MPFGHEKGPETFPSTQMMKYPQCDFTWNDPLNFGQDKALTSKGGGNSSCSTGLISSGAALL